MAGDAQFSGLHDECGAFSFGSAYKFKNLGDNPNLLNSHPEAAEELRAELGVSYYFENKNETSE